MNEKRFPGAENSGELTPGISLEKNNKLKITVKLRKMKEMNLEIDLVKVDSGSAVQVNLKEEEFIMVNGVVITNDTLSSIRFIQNSMVEADCKQYFNNDGFTESALSNFGNVSLFMVKANEHYCEPEEMNSALYNLKQMFEFIEGLRCPDRIKAEAGRLYNMATFGKPRV